MPLSSEQLQLLFYEIAMSIGNSLDLRTMLKESLGTYLRKLNCSAGGVLIRHKTPEGLIQYVPAYTIPRNIDRVSLFGQVSDRILRPMEDEAHARFQSGLPLHEDHGSTHLHLMDLPGFGLLFIIRNSTDLSVFTLKSLGPLNAKLASACLACCQKEEITAVNERLRAIVSSSHDWIWETDAEGRFTYVSDSVRELLGYEPAEILTKTCLDLMDRSEAQRQAPEFVRRVAERAVIEDLESWLTGKDGRRLCMLTNGFPIIHEDQLKGYRGVDKDITLWKSAEHQLRLAKEKAEHVSRAKTEFVANISHEIRTPMNAILGFTDFLCEDPLSPKQQEYLHSIKFAGRTLLRLIDDILDLSKIEAGAMDVDPTSCLLDQVIRPVESLLKGKALAKGLGFLVDRSGDVPPALQTDPLRLQQCLINLVNNAIKFTERGRVVLRMSRSVENDTAMIRFDVEDTGIGIPEARHTDIFKPFTQADGSTVRKYGGTGLGLTITKRLVELLEGRVTLESSPGKGSVFTVILPVRHSRFVEQPVAGRPAASARPSQPNTPTSLCGRILVAEDDRVNQTIIQHVLERSGLEVTVADNGQQALDQVRSAAYDLVLMDIQMPVMNGYEATRHIRALSPDLPVVALTAHAMKGEKEKCLEAGCQDYLTKPIDKAQLFEVLRRHLVPDCCVGKKQ